MKPHRTTVAPAKTTAPATVPAPVSVWPQRTIGLQGAALDLVAGPTDIYAVVATSISAPERPALAAIDPVNGSVRYATGLGGTVAGITYANGLWVAVDVCAATPAESPCQLILQQRDPTSLAVIHRVVLGTLPGPGAGLAAVPGGPLWVAAGGDLFRLAPSTLAVQRFSGPGIWSGSGSVSVDPSGRLLYTAVERSNQGGVVVNERDARTGALLATNDRLGSVVGGGVSASAGGVWVSVPTGMDWAVVRLSAAGLAQIVPSPGRLYADSSAVNPVNAWGQGAGGAWATVSGGELWLTAKTPGLGGVAPLACANVTTGTVRASDSGPSTAGPGFPVVERSGLLYAGLENGLAVIHPPDACLPYDSAHRRPYPSGPSGNSEYNDAVATPPGHS